MIYLCKHMGQKKLIRFAEIATFNNVLEYPADIKPLLCVPVPIPKYLAVDNEFGFVVQEVPFHISVAPVIGEA